MGGISLTNSRSRRKLVRLQRLFTNEVTHGGEHEAPTAEYAAKKARFEVDSKVEVAFRNVEASAPEEPEPDYQPDTTGVTAEAGGMRWKETAERQQHGGELAELDDRRRSAEGRAPN